MTDLTDQQQEALEHAHHSAHAAESGDPMVLGVTLSIAVMAVIAAFIGALGETEASHTFVEKNDAVLEQAKASDAWNEYQAESIKRHVSELGISLATTPELAATAKEQAEKYRNQQPGTQGEAKSHEAQVKSHSEKADRHFERHHVLTVAEGIVHVAVAGASIALLAHRRSIWYSALALTVIGAIVAVAAYLA
jgi:hypothetical protein